MKVLLALLGLSTILVIPVPANPQTINTRLHANKLFVTTKGEMGRWGDGDKLLNQSPRILIPPPSQGGNLPKGDSGGSSSLIATPYKQEILVSQYSNSDPQTLLQQGIEIYQAEQFWAAIKVWQQAVSAFREQENGLGEALVLSNLSLAYQHLGEWEQAKKAIEQSLYLLKNRADVSNAPGYFAIVAKATNTQGRLLWAKGLFPEALSSWKEAARYYLQARDEGGVILAQINQAKTLQALGLSRQSLELLQQVYQNLQQQSNSELKATGLRNLGNALRKVGDLTTSRQVLLESRQLATKSSTQSSLLLELGNTERALGLQASAIGKQAEAQELLQAAIASYQEAAKISDSAKRLQAQLNQLSLLVEMELSGAALQLLPNIQQSLPLLPNSRTKVYATLNFAQSLIKLASSSKSPNYADIAELLATNLQQARTLGETRAESYTLGQLGRLYELSGQYSESQTLTQQALLKADQIQATEIRYLWEWQLGRLAEQQGDLQGAIAAYSNAVETVKSIRSDLIAINPEVQFSFRDRVEPLYRGLVRLLLTSTNNSPLKSENLQQAIRTIDALQLAELENFLGCKLLAQGQLDLIQDPKAVIIYPIITEERLVTIFQIPGQPLGYRETQVKQREVEETIGQLRHNLTIASNTPEVLESAQKLYQWLWQPLEPAIATSKQVETLVFVLDGPLRNIPMAVLYDGEEYLIEKGYSVAVAPRLELFRPQQSLGESLTVNLGGVGFEQQIEGISFPPIEKLEEELERVGELVNAREPLLNENFTTAKIQEELRSENFSAIHWKTHGVFSSDPEATYIVAYNERIKAADLRNLIQTSSDSGSRPLELLVLSACETAQGDERAVLGLAGIALQTGARSVLSTLWIAKDVPNTEFMTRFYQELAQPGVTKAEAVRRSQLALLQEYGYTTPHIWGTYVLLGNWL